MFFFELISEALRNLRRHKLRSFLTALGIIFGIASVMSMVSTGEGARRAILEQISVPDRLRYVEGLVREQLQFVRIKHETDAHVREDIERTQREFYLRRQLKVLREELGESSREEEAAKMEFQSNDFWFTKKADNVYVIALERPENGQISVQALKGQAVTAIRLLGSAEEISWKEGDAAVDIQLPAFEGEGIGYALEVALSQ